MHSLMCGSAYLKTTWNRISWAPLEAEALQPVDSSSWSLSLCVTTSNGDPPKNIIEAHFRFDPLVVCYVASPM